MNAKLISCSTLLLLLCGCSGAVVGPNTTSSSSSENASSVSSLAASTSSAPPVDNVCAGNLTNLALNRPATESSNDGNAGAANSAFDGNITTRWSSGFNDGEWLSVDLGGTFKLCRANISWEDAYAIEYQIQTSLDGDNWSTAATEYTGDGGIDALVFEPVTRARYVRLLGIRRATEWGISMWEFEVLGSREGIPSAAFVLAEQTVEVDKAVMLDAALSFDEDGQIESYQWLVIPPMGVPFNLEGQQTHFTPALTGTYQIVLNVTDDEGNIASTENVANVQPAARASAFPDTVTKPRIMLLGDSITGGSGCWKKILNRKLLDNGITNFEFVGSRSDDCGGGIWHEGHSCATAQNFTQLEYNNFCSGTESGLRPLLEINKPDMIMMTLGTNDAWGAAGTTAILQSYTTLVEQMRAYNPNMVIAVAQIPKMKPDGSQAVYNKVADLVTAVPSWALGINRPNSPVFVSDLWTNFNLEDTTDGVHPSNDVGHVKVADNWFNTIANILRK